MKILIYNDSGTGKNCTPYTYNLFKSHFQDFYKVAYVNSFDLLNSNWETETKLLVIPGGRDLPYKEKLNGEGNKRIKQFVANGGSYLGICAGAYYGSKQIEFGKGSKYEIIEERELAFIDCIARGPTFGIEEFSYDENSVGKLVKVSANDSYFYSYYNGGCFFELNKNNYEILASYQELNNLPAVVYGKYQKGNIILSGIHFEYDINCLSPKILYSDREKFVETENKKDIFIYELIKKLNLKI